MFQADVAVVGALALARAELTIEINRGRETGPKARRLKALVAELTLVYTGARPLIPGSALALAVEAATRRAEQAKDKARFAVCGITETLSAFPPGLAGLPADCRPVGRREAKRIAANLDDPGVLGALLNPELVVRLPRPAVARGRPPRAVRAVSEGVPRLPGRPRAPRAPRAARPKRPPRVPRRPRKPRASRPPRAARVRKKRPLPTQGKGSGWFWYCVKQGPGKWEGLPPRCHRLHMSQAAAASALSPGATFTRTEDCEACKGAGCTGPFAGPFNALMGKLFAAPPGSEEISEGERKERRGRRRRERNYLVAIERQAGDFEASLFGPGVVAGSGYGWYRCTTVYDPPRGVVQQVKWIHATQAEASTRAGGPCVLISTDRNQKPS